MNTIELYSQLIKANALAYDSPIAEHIIKNFFRLASSNSETETSDLELFYDGIASAIYNIADKLRGNIDQLKGQSASPAHGLSRSEKTSIMLLGETSAGKTSFSSLGVSKTSQFLMNVSLFFSALCRTKELNIESPFRYVTSS